jgi:hypothetical protein
VLCGNVNISFPFGLIPEGAKQTSCGADIGFQLRCSNNTPYLGSYQSESNMQILSIFYDNRSLLITNRSPLSTVCLTPKENISSQLVAPFSISSVNQNLIFYNWTKPPSPGGGLVETVCHNNTFLRAADGRSGESAGSYILQGYTAAMVPMLGVPGKVNASTYEQLVRDGFVATWQWPPPPPPPGNFALGTSIYRIYLSIYQLSRKRNNAFGL